MPSPFHAYSPTHQLSRPSPLHATRHAQHPTSEASPAHTPPGDSNNQRLVQTHGHPETDADAHAQNRRLSSASTGTDTPSPNARLLRMQRGLVEQRPQAARARLGTALHPQPRPTRRTPASRSAIAPAGPATPPRIHDALSRDLAENQLEQVKTRLQILLLRQERIVKRQPPPTMDEWQDLADEIAHEREQLCRTRDALFAIDDGVESDEPDSDTID